MLNIIDELNKSCSFDYAFLTTYNFAPGFFEDRLLETKALRSCPNIVILIDEGQYQKLCDDPAGGRLINRRYMLIPVHMPNANHGVFHPKLWLLTGKDKAKLFIGSSNISRPGLTSNLEMVSCFEYENGEKHAECLHLFKSAYDFIYTVANRNCFYSETLGHAIKQAGLLSTVFSEIIEKNENLFIIHNLELSILEQFLKQGSFGSSKITVLCPYFDQNIEEILNVFTKRTKTDKLELIIQQNTNTLDIKALKKWHNKNKNVGLCTKILSAPGRRLHAKIILMESSGGKVAMALVGSANFTKAALLGNAQKEGNIELCLLLKNEVPKTIKDAFGSDFFSLKKIDLEDIQPLLSKERNFNNIDNIITLYHAELISGDSTIKVKCNISPELLNSKYQFSLLIKKLGSNEPDTVCALANIDIKKGILSFIVELQDITALSKAATVAIHAKKDDIEIISNYIWLLNLAEMYDSIKKNDAKIVRQFTESGKGLIDFINNYIDQGMVDKAIDLLEHLNIKFDSGGRKGTSRPILRKPHSPITEDGLPPNFWRLTVDQRQIFAYTISEFIIRHYEKVFERHIAHPNLNGLENFLDVMETCADLAITALKNGILDSSKVRDILLNGFYYFSGNNLLDGYFRELWRKYFVTQNTLKEVLLKHKVPERIIAYSLLLKTLDLRTVAKKVEFINKDDICNLTSMPYLSHFFSLVGLNKDFVERIDDTIQGNYNNSEYCKVRFEYAEVQNTYEITEA